MQNAARIVEQPVRVEGRSRLRLLPGEGLPPLLAGYDPAFVARLLRLTRPLVERYYRAEVEGAGHLSAGRCMIVATHNGGYHMPDAFALYHAYLGRFGPEARVYGMTHGAPLRAPVVGGLLAKVGAIPASPENAHTVLEHGFPLMVCPGGDADALKPFAKRHRIHFGRRRGFIRLALREQVPIIPTVSVGAHEALFMLNEGRRTARLLGFDRLFRIKAVPMALSVPFGMTPAGVFSLPLPTKVKVRVLPPIDLGEPPEAADDPARVEACFARVRGAMQAALDDLASKRRWPVLG